MDEITQLQAMITDFVKARDWDKFHIPKNLAMSISIESAELMEVFQWMTTDESSNLQIIEKFRNEIEDEVADIMIYLIAFVNKCKISLDDVVRKKLARNEKRFPINNVRGSLGTKLDT